MVDPKSSRRHDLRSFQDPAQLVNSGRLQRPAASSPRQTAQDVWQKSLVFYATRLLPLLGHIARASYRYGIRVWLPHKS